MNINIRMVRHWRLAVMLAMWVVAAPGAALAGDFIVVVNKASTVKVDKAMVTKIYQGDLRSWPDGTPVAAFDQAENSPIRASFCTDVIGKSVANLRALWAQMVFSGKALPPKQLASDDEVKKAVSGAKGGVGYIKASAIDDSVKMAFE